MSDWVKQQFVCGERGGKSERLKAMPEPASPAPVEGAETPLAARAVSSRVIAMDYCGKSGFVALGPREHGHNPSWVKLADAEALMSTLSQQLAAERLEVIATIARKEAAMRGESIQRERAEQAEAALAKSKRHAELLQHALDRMPFCPDCRDKVQGRECPRCRYQSAEAALARLQAAQAEPKKRATRPQGELLRRKSDGVIWEMVNPKSLAAMRGMHARQVRMGPHGQPRHKRRWVLVEDIVNNYEPLPPSPTDAPAEKGETE